MAHAAATASEPVRAGFLQRLAAPRHRGMLVLAATVVLLPFALRNSYFLDVAILVALNAVVCVGLNLLIGYAGQISLGHAGFFALGAYGTIQLEIAFSCILSASSTWTTELPFAAKRWPGPRLTLG